MSTARFAANDTKAPIGHDGAMSLTVHRHASVDEFLSAGGAFLGEREAENNLLFGISSAIRATPEVFADEPPQFATVTDAEVGWWRPPSGPRRTTRCSPQSTTSKRSMRSSRHSATSRSPVCWANRRRRAFRGRLDRCHRACRAPAVRRAHLSARAPDPAGSPGCGDVADGGEARSRPARTLGGRVHGRSAAGSASDAGSDGRRRSMDRAPRPGRLPVGGRRRDRLVGRCRRRNAARHPHRPGLHPAVAAQPRLRELVDRRGQRRSAGGGRRFCFLFTDLANPTSNKIYQAIGYEPVCDVDQYGFATDA